VSKAVYFHLSLKINEGKTDAFRKIVDEMTALTKAESGALGYEWYLSADASRCRLVETYADEAAVMAHITGTAVRDVLPQLLQVSTITSFEVYGDPGAKAAASLTASGAELFQQIAGIVRR
jgi:quinol monooxygenase YgiN